jgi:two-component system, OmpR family, sensor histidine kinase KdpD
MSIETNRPDPDALLASIKKQEERERRGKLKVFLGMCPGVGKTYAMLEAAHREKSDGVDVAIAIIETHGRPKTEALVKDLELISRKTVIHRGISLTEMDIEAVLARRPRLVLVDELAHSNAPGSPHPKRWQDVVELIESGIDVLTTLNIQHVESRADAVSQITGTAVRETVPDSIIEMADEIELVDITAQDLRERLEEGNVYQGDRAAIASENFFQEPILNALRELALRYTAERVDRQLSSLRHGQTKSGVWQSGERLMVAVDTSPFSTQLVRWARRSASAQDAPWIAVHVMSASPLTPESQAQLDQNLALARELGGEVVLAQSENVPMALVQVAIEHNASQIIIGKPRGNRWRYLISGGDIIDRLLSLAGNINVNVIPPSEEHNKTKPWLVFEPPPASSFHEYSVALAMVAAISFAGLLILDKYYLTIGLFYLLGIVILSLKIGRWPVLFAGFLSAVTWEFLFIPPKFSFRINNTEDWALFVSLLIVAVVVGQLTARIRTQAQDEHNRERRATALFKLTSILSETENLDDALTKAQKQIDETFKAHSAIVFISSTDSKPEIHPASSAKLDNREQTVANWAHSHRRPAGRFTDTLPGSKGFFLPIMRHDVSFGALGVFVPENEILTLQQRDLLDSFTTQIAMVIERFHLRAASERERLLAESERLYRTLHECVSHELRTPLAVITGTIESLANAKDETSRQELSQEIREATQRLNRLVGNLLDQTRLESGALKPKLDWCDPRDLVNAAIKGSEDVLKHHPYEIHLPDDLPPILADFTLTEQAIGNLIVNSALHTPAGTHIYVTAGIDRDATRAFFTIADDGPGFPQEMKDRLFKKFARGDAAKAGGLGLGLSIVRGFILAQGGDIAIGENPNGGAITTLFLPFQAPQKSVRHESL